MKLFQNISCGVSGSSSLFAKVEGDGGGAGDRQSTECTIWGEVYRKSLKRIGRSGGVFIVNFEQILLVIMVF